MDLKTKTYYISFVILLICILIALLIYMYTGTIFIAILFAPPIIHWILRKRQSGDV